MEKTKKLLAILLIIAMLIGCLTVRNISFANGDEDPNDPPPVDDGQLITVDFGTASWTIDGVTVTAAIWGEEALNQGPMQIGDNQLIKLDHFNNETMEIKITGENNFNATLSLVSNDETKLNSANCEGLPDSVTFSVVKKQQQGPSQGGEDAIEIDALFTNTHMNLWINDIVVMSDQVEFMNQFDGVVDHAGTTDSTKTNVLRFCVPFGDYPISEYTINDVTYKEGDPEVVINNDEYIITVPGAAKYTIRGEADTNAAVARTIIWANVDVDKNADEYEEDMLLEHGTAGVKAVYSEDNQLVDPSAYIGEHSGQDGVADNGMGWVTIRPNSRVIFEFVPEYGYQLTSVKANGMALEPQDKINQYEFIMPDTNVHFSATFTKIADTVETGSGDIASGKIKLGRELEGGTAKLTVNDIELSEEQISNFEEEAGDYKITKFLNIELFNIFYKGKNDDNDVWSNQIKELESDATITLQLEEGVDGNQIVIVHEKHDGTYEIIPATYDAETHTITFKTRAFSNYAIAAKTGGEIEYTVDRDDFVATFMDEDGHEFEMIVINFAELTDEDLVTFDIPKELYDQLFATVVDNTKSYGDFIAFYDFTIVDPSMGYTHDGEITLKIKLTDKMKKYNTFKLLEIDGESYSVATEIEATVDGDYIVAKLPSVLNAFALTGEYVEPTEENETNNESNNPQTGDIIAGVTAILVFAIVVLAMTTKKRRVSKH